jgi:hypothetical protein
MDVAFIHPSELVAELIDTANAYQARLEIVRPGARIIVHEDAAKIGHVNDSAHYRGEAFDFHVVGVPLAVAWIEASRFAAFRGLGFYLWWQHPGMHADCRQAPYRALWWCKERGIYLGVDGVALAALADIPPPPA